MNDDRVPRAERFADGRGLGDDSDDAGIEERSDHVGVRLRLVDAREDDADHVGTDAVCELSGLFRVTERLALRRGDQDDLVGELQRDERVVAQPRTGVDDDDVVARFERRDDRFELLGVRRRERFERVRAGEHRESRRSVVDGGLDRRLARQHVVERRPVGVDAERAGEVRHPEVTVDDDDVVTGHRERRPEVGRARRLSNPAFRAGNCVHPGHNSNVEVHP